jgi:hypothetical protein
MSGLKFTTAACRGWALPIIDPTISSLSGYQSPVGASILVSILGTNFRSYSTITFGSYKPTAIFISSQQIDFYIPSGISSAGPYSVQVFNDTRSSNIVSYYLDNGNGHWFYSPGDLTISNTNSNGVILNGNTNMLDDLIVGGTIYGTLETPSDYRIKENIESLDLLSVDNLKPIKYFNKKTEQIEIGFLAHEVQEIFPYLVTGEKDGKNTQTLNYIGLIGVLVKEIQDLKADVNALKNA